MIDNSKTQEQIQEEIDIIQAIIDNGEYNGIDDLKALCNEKQKLEFRKSMAS